METTREEVRKALKEAGLENAGAGVVFPWGVKIVDFEGKKMLQPATPGEYKAAVEQETGRVLSDAEVKTPYCVYAGPAACSSQGCQQAGGYCTMHYYQTGGWYCLCNH